MKLLTIAVIAIVGWRTDGTGTYPKANPLTKWSTTQNVIWKTPLAKWSNATPIIVGDRLFVCGEPVGPDGLADEPLAIDPASLVAGDVYAALRGRGKDGMFATDPALRQAQAERRRHLLEMAAEGKTVVGIDQLLSSLSRRTENDAPRDKKESGPQDGR